MLSCNGFWSIAGFVKNIKEKRGGVLFWFGFVLGIFGAACHFCACPGAFRISKFADVVIKQDKGAYLWIFFL